MEIEETRIQRIETQIGILKSEICRETRKNTTLFLLGLTMGLLANIIIPLLFF